MTKRISENFLMQTGNFFTFSTPKCRCTKDVLHDEHDRPMYSINIRTLYDDPIEYDFAHGNGLTMKNSDTNTNSGNCCPVGALMALKLDDSEKSSNALVNYIEKFGYFFSLGTDNRCQVNYNDLCIMLKKVQLLVKLLNTIEKAKPRYSEMYNAIMDLNFFPAIESKLNNKNLYPTVEHKFHDYFMDPNSIDYSHSPLNYIQQHQNEDKHPEQYCLFDTFTNNAVKCIYEYPDGYVCQALDEDSDDENGRIRYLYFNYLDGDDYTRRLIDFHWHIYMDISKTTKAPTENFKLDRGIIHYLKNNDLDQLEAFNDKYKAFLTMIAKLTIKREMDSIISTIHPVYNTETLSLDWHIENLFTGMYLSLLYMNPKQEMFRKCGRPKCQEYFRINITNSRKVYCSNQCRNAMAQLKYRLTHQNAAENLTSTDKI